MREGGRWGAPVVLPVHSPFWSLGAPALPPFMLTMVFSSSCVEGSIAAHGSNGADVRKRNK